MSKLWNYFGILSITIIVFNIFGLLNGGVFSTFYTLITNPSSLPVSSIAVLVVGAITTGIFATYVGSYRSDMTVMAPLLLVLVPMGWDVTQIIAVLTSINVTLGLVVGGPTLFLFIITILEWWRGTDN